MRRGFYGGESSSLRTDEKPKTPSSSPTVRSTQDHFKRHVLITSFSQLHLRSMYFETPRGDSCPLSFVSIFWSKHGASCIPRSLHGCHAFAVQLDLCLRSVSWEQLDVGKTQALMEQSHGVLLGLIVLRLSTIFCSILESLVVAWAPV
jgi:hypothetical protein